jgi:hypothetical protein
MKTIKNDYCIRQFVSSDTLRPAMMNNAENPQLTIPRVIAS